MERGGLPARARLGGQARCPFLTLSPMSLRKGEPWAARQRREPFEAQGKQAPALQGFPFDVHFRVREITR
jgi:hypothetical protein